MAVTKKDLHHLIDEVATDEHTIDKAFRLLSSLKGEVDRIDPIPLPTSGTSAEDLMRFFETHSLSPEDAEDMTRFTEEFDRLDNLASWGVVGLPWEF